MAAQDIAAVQKIIQPIGLAPTKAKNVVNMSKVLMQEPINQPAVLVSQYYMHLVWSIKSEQ